ncbi:MAG: carboxypeptidase-like regulatory domain-containing protein [Breznakibacter sp.]
MKRPNTNSNKPHDRQRVLDYLAGKLDANEQHRMERDAMSDPFLADALDGLSRFDAAGIGSDLASLDESLPYRKKRQLWPMLWKIASAVLLLLIPGTLIWIIMQTTQQRKNTLAHKTDAHSVLDSVAPLAAQRATEPPQMETSTPMGPPQTSLTKKQVSKEPLPDVPSKTDETPNETIPVPSRLSRSETETVVAESVKTDEPSSTPRIHNALSGKVAGVQTQSISVPQASHTIHGRVLDELGEPIMGATVGVKGAITGTTTNIDGEYSISVSDSMATLYTSFVGYKTSEIALKDLKNKTKADIVIQPDLMALDEVVVTGYGVQKKSVLTGAATKITVDDHGAQTGFIAPVPEAGMDKYMKKLESTLVYPVSGSGQKEVVVAKLTIDANGRITYIDIVKSPNDDFSREAIRAINNAGGWQAASMNGKPVTSHKRLRIVFNPVN